ncbi:hypothetical protein ACA910_002247 [Epithemia clementina (nom. ined.)]
MTTTSPTSREHSNTRDRGEHIDNFARAMVAAGGGEEEGGRGGEEEEEGGEGALYSSTGLEMSPKKDETRFHNSNFIPSTAATASILINYKDNFQNFKCDAKLQSWNKTESILAVPGALEEPMDPISYVVDACRRVAKCTISAILKPLNEFQNMEEQYMIQLSKYEHEEMNDIEKAQKALFDQKSLQLIDSQQQQHLEEKRRQERSQPFTLYYQLLLSVVVQAILGALAATDSISFPVAVILVALWLAYSLRAIHLFLFAKRRQRLQERRGEGNMTTSRDGSGAKSWMKRPSAELERFINEV